MGGSVGNVCSRVVVGTVGVTVVITGGASVVDTRGGSVVCVDGVTVVGTVGVSVTVGDRGAVVCVGSAMLVDGVTVVLGTADDGAVLGAVAGAVLGTVGGKTAGAVVGDVGRTLFLVVTVSSDAVVVTVCVRVVVTVETAAYDAVVTGSGATTGGCDDEDGSFTATVSTSTAATHKAAPAHSCLTVRRVRAIAAIRSLLRRRISAFRSSKLFIALQPPSRSKYEALFWRDRAGCRSAFPSFSSHAPRPDRTDPQSIPNAPPPAYPREASIKQR